VVRLKGGDPGVFGRLAEEIEPLHEAGVDWEIVPGVTAALAAAAVAGMPLTSRQDASSITIVTGHEAFDKRARIGFSDLAALPGTLVVYMGVEQVARWSRDLLAAGRPGDTPVTLVSRCTWPDQRVSTTTLDRCASVIAEQGWLSPAIVIVGPVAHGPMANRPLAGRRVMVTRPVGQGDELTRLLVAEGADCLGVPLAVIEPPSSWAPLDEALGRADLYDWIVLTSVNGVRSFVERMRATSRDGRCLGTARLAVIGPATRQALEAAGLVADLEPREPRSEGLLEALEGAPRGARFLLLRADRSREVLRPGLEARGHRVDDVIVYRNRPVERVPREVMQEIERSRIDWITLTSPSIARAACAAFGPLLSQWKIATISGLTSEAVRAAGFSVTAEAAEASSAGLVAAMVGAERVAGSDSPSRPILPSSSGGSTESPGTLTTGS